MYIVTWFYHVGNNYHQPGNQYVCYSYLCSKWTEVFLRNKRDIILRTTVQHIVAVWCDRSSKCDNELIMNTSPKQSHLMSLHVWQLWKIFSDISSTMTIHVVS
jgi:hypothetical protein